MITLKGVRPTFINPDYAESASREATLARRAEISRRVNEAMLPLLEKALKDEVGNEGETDE